MNLVKAYGINIKYNGTLSFERLVTFDSFAGTKEQMIDYLHNELNWDLPRDNYNPLANEYINRFGNIYILLYD